MRPALVMRAARVFSATAAILVLSMLPDAARAAETIKSFASDITVEADGSMRVAETIRVSVEGDQIKHGIFRVFPMRSAQGNPVTFDVASVTRNGAAEPYTVERDGDNTQVRIGSATVDLPAPSEQTYVITYETNGQISSFNDFDELYWNVTGNDWAFPIEAATVAIHLPAGTEITRHSGYTGPTGAQGKDFRTTKVEAGLFEAETTAALPPGSGFTVAVGFPTGIVTVSRVGEWFGFPNEEVAAFASSAAGIIALIVAWFFVGRDPPRGVIAPEFDPPKGLGPAAMAYVRQMDADSRAMTAAVISMAVKGALKISEITTTGLLGHKTYRLDPLGSADKGLTPAESAAYGAIFSTGGPIELRRDRENGRRMDNARNNLASRLREEYYGVSFRDNFRYVLAAVAFGVVVAVALFSLAQPLGLDSLSAFLVAAVGAAIVCAVLARTVNRMVRVVRGPGSVFGRILKVGLPVIFIVFFGGLWLSTAAVSLMNDFGGAPVEVAIAGAIFGIAAIVFDVLMAAPTKAGRKLLDQIEGFQLYMATAEKDRLNILNPPEETPELFERLLPYAVALGLAHEWSARFAGILAVGTQPQWYSGPGSFDAGTFGDSFGGAVASAGAPSSSSGSGGGGMSGGGGGGGGGGGW